MKKSLIFVGLLACWLVGLSGCGNTSASELDSSDVYPTAYCKQCGLTCDGTIEKNDCVETRSRTARGWYCPATTPCNCLQVTSKAWNEKCI